MGIPPDVWSVVIVAMIGLLFIGALALRPTWDTYFDPEIRKVLQMNGEKLKKKPAEGLDSFRHSPDFRSAVQTLAAPVRLEIAEGLLEEDEPFCAIALEVLEDLAITGDVELRRKAVTLLRSDAISPDRCISLAVRVVTRGQDSEVKIEAIGAMLYRVRDAEARSKTTGLSAVVHALVPLLKDPDRLVRRAARDSFSSDGPLHAYLAAVDCDIRDLLTTVRGPVLVELGYFVIANANSLVTASDEARRRGIEF